MHDTRTRNRQSCIARKHNHRPGRQRALYKTFFTRIVFWQTCSRKKKIPLHSVPINKGMPSVPMQGPVSLKLMKATPFEEAQIRLSLIELRRSKGVTMTGIEKWSLYYSIAQSINVAPTTLQPVVDRTLSTSSSNTSLDNLIAAADECLGSP